MTNKQSVAAIAANGRLIRLWRKFALSGEPQRSRRLRPLMVVLHRWLGLATAVFLFISGLTGAVISWDHEIDGWLNPALFQATHTANNGPIKSGLELAQQVEARDRRVRVVYVLTELVPGHTALMSVEGRLDPATGKPFKLGFNQMAVNPITGNVQGTRQWGTVSLTRENLLPFLYKLHYTMHIPDGWGIELGIWFMGIIGIVWFFDCFIALYLSFPNWRSWRKSVTFRFRQGRYKLNFDLHRSGGVWVWMLLLVLALTSVSMNLQTQLMRPLVAQFSSLSHSAFDSRTPQPPERPIEPLLTREQVVALARDEGRKQGLQLPPGGVLYLSSYGLYAVGFFNADNDHGDGGLGNAWLYFDCRNGQPAGATIPGRGSTGDIFLQAQFPLHSGRILGLTGRIVVSAMGLIVALLSVTGLIIWIRKGAARARQLHKAGAQLAAQ